MMEKNEIKFWNKVSFGISPSQLVTSSSHFSFLYGGKIAQTIYTEV